MSIHVPFVIAVTIHFSKHGSPFGIVQCIVLVHWFVTVVVLNNFIVTTVSDVAKKKLAEPKSYPLAKGDWSSCDESEDELSILWDAIVATWGS